MVPLLALLAAACSDVSGPAAWETFTLPSDAETASVSTTTPSTGAAGLHREGIVEVLHGEAAVLPTSYRFTSEIVITSPSGDTTLAVEGAVNGQDFHYEILPLGSLEEVTVTNGSVWVKVDGQWFTHEAMRPPNPHPLLVAYPDVTLKVYFDLGDDYSIVSLGSSEIDGLTVTGQHVDIPEIVYSLEVGGSRTLDLWFDDRGFLIRVDRETEPPAGHTYAAVTRLIWQVCDVNEPVEVVPPNPGEVVHADVFADEDALEDLRSAVAAFRVFLIDYGRYPKTAEEITSMDLDLAYSLTEDLHTVTPGAVGFQSFDDSLLLVTVSRTGTWHCTIDRSQEGAPILDGTTFGRGDSLEAVDTLEECSIASY